MDIVMFVRAEEYVGGPLLEPDHPVLEVAEGDEAVQSGLHIKYVPAQAELEGVQDPAILLQDGVEFVEFGCEGGAYLHSRNWELGERPHRPSAVPLHV
jgi:hypothetical protein